MTDKTKLDEAASLTLSAQNGDMTSSTTITAEDVAALAVLLKNAGIAGNSTMFNGAATLTMDVEENGGTMNTMIQAPDLRSIMHLLEPEFAELGDEESIEDQAADALVADQAQDAYNAEHPEVKIAQDEVEAELTADAQDDMAVDVAPVDLDVDLDGTLDADLGEDADYDYRDHEVGPEEYEGVADRKPVQAQTKSVPARSGDNPMKGFKDYFKEANERNYVEPKPAVTAESLLDEFRIDELSNDAKNRYFKKAADDINNHANHAEKMRGIGNDEQADKHDRHIMKRAHGMNRAIAKPGSK